MGKRVTNKEIIQKLEEIEGMIQYQESSQFKSWIVSLGVSLIIFGLGILIFGLSVVLGHFTLEDLARSFVSISLAGLV